MTTKRYGEFLDQQGLSYAYDLIDHLADEHDVDILRASINEKDTRLEVHLAKTNISIHIAAYKKDRWLLNVRSAGEKKARHVSYTVHTVARAGFRKALDIKVEKAAEAFMEERFQEEGVRQPGSG